jgi:hypothetical protein
MTSTSDYKRLALAVAAGMCLAWDGTALAQQAKDGVRPPVRAGASSGQAAPAAAKPPSELSFTTHLDRTAVWIGDQFHYHIFVDHSPRIRFIVENVNKDTINLDPLRVVNVTASTMPLSNGNERLLVDLTLTALITATPELQIPQVSLFYFRREGTGATTTSEGAAAESLTIPGPIIGLRSTLLPKASQLRDAVTVTGWPRARWIVAGAGWCALVLLVGGVAWEGAQLIRGRRRRRGPDPRKAMAAIRERWTRSVPADFSDPAVMTEFYGRSYNDLKAYLGYLMETHTEGLSAEEVRGELAQVPGGSELADRASKVLEICEAARYAQNPAELNAGVASEVAESMRQIFQVKEL